jgi:hypothetical protein
LTGRDQFRAEEEEPENAKEKWESQSVLETVSGKEERQLRIGTVDWH